MFDNILSRQRKNILPYLETFKNDFYLAGGTALALQIGHRESIDFDFFSEKKFNNNKLFEQIKNNLSAYQVKKVQDEKDTLTVILDNQSKISFFFYPYPLLEPLITEKYLNVASIRDIACMKLSAIVNRSVQKDYVDLYFILQQYPLSELLQSARKKFPEIETNLIIKSLVYFDDLNEEPINFKNNQDVSLNRIKHFLRQTVKNYLSK